MHATASEFLGETLSIFEMYKRLGEGALSQASDEDLFRRLDEESLSIALIVKHLRGNMLSRWRDFLSTDGEKPNRDRESEFEDGEGQTRAAVEAWWEEGWAEVFGAIEALRPTDLGRTVTIRGEPLSVLQAITRQMTHYAYHVGQMVFLAKHFRGATWDSLSIPRRR
ncbi:MAG: DUF1572 domain-containing protein [Gemmatimonadetes bacterium]|nr:DUF1572 domain-containing protein [Gemmatimonadota bacterium]